MQKKKIWELVRFTIIAIVIVLPIRMFIAQPFIVSGSSMYPTFKDGQYLIIDEISYQFEKPKRNEVIVFRYPNEKKKFFIKRVIALPNEEIKIRGSEIIIINEENPEGFKLDQTYIKNPGNDNISFKLKEDEYYVAGDNRISSYDSRSWGPVNEKLIIGKVFFRLFPLKDVAITPGNLE